MPLFHAVLVGATAITLAFLLFPLLAIFFRIPPSELLLLLRNEAVVDAIVVTVRTNAVAGALILLVGTPAAYYIATRRFRARNVVVTLVELPLVLPPAVAGIGLLAAFGRRGLLGGELSALGVSISFTEVAVVFAVVFVASPFYIRQAIAAFEALDQTLVDASRTLGAGAARTFWRVAVPVAAGSLGAGAALSFARGIGEFGATIMFAGSTQGVTQTLPLAIYANFGLHLDVALAMGALLIVVSAVVLLAFKFVPSWKRSTSTSLFPFVRSGSS